jgi:toxin secretion/phage lysis holin
MNDMKNVTLLVVPTFSAYLTGLKWEFFYIWMILILLDVVTGIIVAIKENKWCSKTMKQGLLKKSGEIIVLMTIVIAQRMIYLNGISVPPIFEILVTAFSFKEIGSILENQIKLGNKIPDFVTKWFKITSDSFAEKIDKKDGE